jgi:predicted tellurium resistance membrane protein TerC
MFDIFFESVFWINLFSVTLIQIALGADNLIIITILANKLPMRERQKAVNWGLVLAMLFRIILLFMISSILKYATNVFYHLEKVFSTGLSINAEFSGKAVILMVGGFFLIWKGVKELRHKIKGVEQEVKAVAKFSQVLFVIVTMNLLFSVDSIAPIFHVLAEFIVEASRALL